MSEIKDIININPVKEIQMYLKEISKHNSNISIKHTDGIFDSETKEAVTIFQRIYGLPPNGTVDLATWSKLLYEYNKITSTDNIPNKLDCFPDNVTEIKLGDKKSIVYIIQILINDLSKKYNNINNIDITGVYDEATEAAVKQFQSINKLPITGIVDIKTWNSLTCINNVCRMQDK
jgi:peptidoglycan hydrolase-like protein with peptidoglycan-binding domain